MHSLWLVALFAPCVFANPLLLNDTRAPPPCGVNKYGTRGDFKPYIVGGRDAVANAYPWQAALYYNNGFWCGGSIISEQYILTAASCIETSNTQAYHVAVGKHNIYQVQEAMQQDLYVDSFKYATYDPKTAVNDIVLIKLKTKIVFNDNVKPICLPEFTIGTFEGQQAIATGWGRLYTDGNFPTYLQEVALPIMANSVCKPLYPAHVIGDGHVCAGYKDGGHDTCKGDSGGPFQVKVQGKWTIVGVTSWGSAICGKAMEPAVFTRVSWYANWIKQNMV